MSIIRMPKYTVIRLRCSNNVTSRFFCSMHFLIWRNVLVAPVISSIRSNFLKSISGTIFCPCLYRQEKQYKCIHQTNFKAPLEHTFPSFFCFLIENIIIRYHMIYSITTNYWIIVLMENIQFRSNYNSLISYFKLSFSLISWYNNDCFSWIFCLSTCRVVFLLYYDKT